MTATAMLIFHIDRDSVCAGDDTDPHQATVAVPASVSLLDLIAAAQQVCPLARIAGSQATWLVDIGRPARCVGVIAQQWPGPRLVIAGDTAAVGVVDGVYSLYFHYWGQIDPQAVLAALRSGQPLPSRAAAS